MRLIWRITRGFFAIVGFLVLLIAIGLGVLAWQLGERVRGPRELPEVIVLTADFREAVPESVGAPSLASLQLTPPPTVAELVLALDRAAADRRVAGLVALLDETGGGLAVTQELRDALARFRAGGKWALAWADSFGELGPGNEGYYLAAAFDEIHLQPTGLVGLTGIASEQPFVAELLARFGIDLEVIRRAEYKTALESFSAGEMSAPNREMLEALLGSLNGQLVADIGRDRKIAPALVRDLVLHGPYTATEAVEHRLIDGIAYRDEVVEQARRRAPGSRPVPIERYAGSAAAPIDAVATVALVQAEGLIMRGEGSLSLQIAADELASAIVTAAESPRTDAILLRLSSRGGSPAASETIHRALRRAVATEKPVVVAMGNVAASGGYWVATGAQRILAQPATLTGSIGVISAKPVLDGLWRELDVDWAIVSPGGHATMWSPNRPYTDEERARLDQLVGELYGEFKDRVAEARGLSLDRVEELARGRVWTGEAALSLGLVDRLGGVGEGLDELRTLLGHPPGAPLEVVTYPERSWHLDRLSELLPFELRLLAGLRTFLRDLTGTGARLEAPPLGLR